jgi:hypothetical protein
MSLKKKVLNCSETQVVTDQSYNTRSESSTEITEKCILTYLKEPQQLNLVFERVLTINLSQNI